MNPNECEYQKKYILYINIVFVGYCMWFSVLGGECVCEHMCVSARMDSASDRGKACAKKTAESEWLKETLLYICYSECVRKIER